MAFKDYLSALARGGLPEVLDTGLQSTRQGDTRPETTAPAGTNRDREAFATGAGSVGATVGQIAPMLLLGAVVIVTGVVVWRVVRR